MASQDSTCSLLASDREKEKGWTPRDNHFKELMCVSRRLAEERHSNEEKAKTRRPGNKPSRAITKKEKSNKKSAEICRMKMEIYTKLLEHQLNTLHSANQTMRQSIIETSNQLEELRARLFRSLRLESSTRKDESNREKIFDRLSTSAPQRTLEARDSHDMYYIDAMTRNLLPTSENKTMKFSDAGLTSQVSQLLIDDDNSPCTNGRIIVGSSPHYPSHGPASSLFARHESAAYEEDVIDRQLGNNAKIIQENDILMKKETLIDFDEPGSVYLVHNYPRVTSMDILSFDANL